MGMLLSEDQVHDLYRHKIRTIRWQRCGNGNDKGCGRALAVEVSDHIGSEGEYWIVDCAIVTKGEKEHFFRRCGRWFGNPMTCPSCGRTGRLPIDEPLSWDLMQKTREGENAVQSN